MKILMNGQICDDQKKLKKLYDEGYEYVYFEDGEYFIDFESLEMED